MKVLIGIPTYLRPKGLDTLLIAISKLEFGFHRGEGNLNLQTKVYDLHAITVLVVDNDINGSAKMVVDKFKASFPWSLEYQIQAERGIPKSRNICLSRALQGFDGGDEFDALAFIDDDEFPDAKWLNELVKMAEKSGADVVTGPVLPGFESTPSRWIIEGKFFERRRLQDGATLNDSTASNNVLIRVPALKKSGLKFDEKMALTGGSDAHFFRRLVAQGFKVTWADHALVTEINPTSRMNVKWLCLRMFRIGTSTASIRRDMLPRGLFIFLTFGSMIKAFGKGAWFLTFSPLRGRAFLVVYIKGLRQIFYGAGNLTGLFGYKYPEYRKIHGS